MADPILTAAERAHIKGVIAEAESRTAGEIFVVVAHASDDYRAIPLLWATLVALILPLPLILFTLLPAVQIYLIQLVVFIAVAIALSHPAVKLLVVPGRIKELHSHRLAVDQFLAHGLHTTEARTGVLIFVSVMERYAEVIADAGINAKVDRRVWDEIVKELIAETKAGRLADGLTIAIEHAGALLSTHFPPRPINRDELPNELIVL
jgi:putative membrane protein